MTVTMERVLPSGISECSLLWLNTDYIAIASVDRSTMKCSIQVVNTTYDVAQVDRIVCAIQDEQAVPKVKY